jgi:hypothetical protein
MSLNILLPTDTTQTTRRHAQLTCCASPRGLYNASPVPQAAGGRQDAVSRQDRIAGVARHDGVGVHVVVRRLADLEVRVQGAASVGDAA